MPGMPLRYNFFFQILDGDDEGKAAKLFESGDKDGKVNDKFKQSAPSGLAAIAYNADSENSDNKVV